MIHQSNTVKAYYFKYASSRYFTTLVTILPDGTRFEWSRNEDGLIYFGWEEGKRVTLFRLMEKLGMNYSLREGFKFVIDYNVWDASNLLQEASDLLLAKKQFSDRSFIDHLFAGMQFNYTADKKKLHIQWQGEPLSMDYINEEVLGQYESRETNLLTPLLGGLIARYLLELKPTDCAVDGESELTWCAKKLIGYAPATLLLGQYSKLTDELAQALSGSDCQSLYLNGLQTLPSKTAEYLSRFKGRLFLDGLSSVSDDSMNILLKHTGRYLSIRTWVLDQESIQKLSDRYDGFLRLGKKTESVKRAVYSEAELAASIVSDKKRFSSLSKLLTGDDKDQIDSALLMYSALSDAPAADALLEGITYFRDGNSGVLVLNNRFKTILKRQPMLNYALLGVIYHAPADSKVASRLREEVMHLQIDLSDLTYLGAFPELRVLELTNSHSDLVSLNGVGECPKLEEVNISGCEAISDIEDLSNLPISRFRFDGCRKITSLASLQGKIDKGGTTELDISRFEQLTTLDGIEFFVDLETLYLSDNHKIISAAALSRLSKLTAILNGPNKSDYMIYLGSCVGLDGLILPNMREISYSIGSWKFQSAVSYPQVESFRIDCAGMTSLDWLVHFPNLRILSIDCADLSDLSGLSHVPKLQRLFLESAAVSTIDAVTVLKQLEKLHINKLPNLLQVDVLRSMRQLKQVEIYSCKALEDISGWASLPCFAADKNSVSIYSLPGIKRLGDVSGLNQIQQVYLRSSFNGHLLTELRKFGSLKSMTVEQESVQFSDSGEPISFELIFKNAKSLSMSGKAARNLTLEKTAITDLSGIAGLTGLEQLTIKGANSLSSLRGLEACTNLSVLCIEDASALESIEAITYCIKLAQITMRGCSRLKDTNVFARMTDLQALDLRESTALTIKPQAYNMNAEQTIRYQEKLLKAMGGSADGALKEKKSKLKEKAAGTVDKKALANIKKLLLSRDIGQIDTAVQLVASINELALFDVLLEGTSSSEGKLVLNKIFTGTGPAQPFLNYGLLQVLSLAAAFDTWKALCAEITHWESELARQAPLEQFTRLQVLHLQGFNKVENSIVLPTLKSLRTSVEIIDSQLFSGCAGVEQLSMSHLTLTNGLSGMSSMTQLRKLTLSVKSMDMSTLQPLANCTQLESLSLSGDYNNSFALSDLSPLSGLTNLRKIQLYRVDLKDSRALVPMSWLQTIQIEYNNVMTELHLPKQATELSMLVLRHLYKLKSVHTGQLPVSGLDLKFDSCDIETFPSLPGVDTLLSLRINNCKVLRDLNALSTVRAIEKFESHSYRAQFDLSGCLALEDISGIHHFENDELVLSCSRVPRTGDPSRVRRLSASKFQSLEGISQFKDLKELNLSNNEDIAGISHIRDLPNLERLTLRGCKMLTSLEGVQYCKNLRHLNIADTEKLSDISALEGMMIEEIFINGCLLKKSDFPAHLQDYIDWQTKPS